ncbi:MAG TPA: hypothetical protein VHE34_14660 [Puia sp.]|uniref:hypothetical protein n=1 Tax=Puia sp. TaxID=2045100 RepID=UPI002C55B3F7|nr:hypothetical protein [Puia sp.]HVU96467.1 hypothetical protein [Puia sp.]
MRSFFWLLLCILPIASQAQDVTGIWQGHFRSAGSTTMRNSVFDDRYRFEVQIAQNGKVLEGVTYSYLSTFFYGKAAAAGTVNVRTAKVLLQEGKLLECRNSMGDVCIMTCFLQYSKSGDEEFLEGTYTSMNVRDSSNCGRGTVFLHKVPISDFYTEPFVAKREKEIAGNKPAAPAKPNLSAAPLHKPATPHATAKNTPATPKDRTGAKPDRPATARTKPPAHPPATARATPPNPSAPPPVVRPTPEKNPRPMAKVDMPKQSLHTDIDSGGTGMGKRFPTIAPRVLQDRQNQVVKTITVHTNEITLNIYDDGAIDHDTVSVYVDNRQVINHAMLTDRPLIVTIHLDENSDYHEVVMVAENEGEIPPNTSLMIVKAGDKEYEVRITSTEQKNAVVKFQYVK